MLEFISAAVFTLFILNLFINSDSLDNIVALLAIIWSVSTITLIGSSVASIFVLVVFSNILLLDGIKFLIRYNLACQGVELPKKVK